MTSNNPDALLPTTSQYCAINSSCVASDSSQHCWVRLPLQNATMGESPLSSRHRKPVANSLFPEHLNFLRPLVQEQFRENYIISNGIVEHLTKQVIDRFCSEQASVTQLRSIQTGVNQYTRDLWKGYLNSMPGKAFAKLITDYLVRHNNERSVKAGGREGGTRTNLDNERLNLSVGLIKQIISVKRVKNALANHAAFKQLPIISDRVVKSLRKETEQRLLVLQAAGKDKLDLDSHQQGFVRWRQNVLTSADGADPSDPLDDLKLNKGDFDLPLTRAYVPYESKRKLSARKKARKQELLDELLLRPSFVPSRITTTSGNLALPSTHPVAEGVLQPLPAAVMDDRASLMSAVDESLAERNGEECKDMGFR